MASSSLQVSLFLCLSVGLFSATILNVSQDVCFEVVEAVEVEVVEVEVVEVVPEAIVVVAGG